MADAPGRIARTTVPHAAQDHCDVHVPTLNATYSAFVESSDFSAVATHVLQSLPTRSAGTLPLRTPARARAVP